jgi:DnaJ-class molecular chaperone
MAIAASKPSQAISSSRRKLLSPSLSETEQQARKRRLIKGPREFREMRGKKDDLKNLPECSGEGVVDQGTEDERRCPTCNGSGIVPDDRQDSEEVWNTQSR